MSSDPAPQPDRRRAARTGDAGDRHRDLVFAIARAAERHDPSTGAHLRRMAALVARLAEALGHDDADELAEDAMLHDVGKLLLEPTLLTKPGPLTPDEQRRMEAHTVHGAALLDGTPSLARAARIARHHHERWDGTGRPDGLAGEAIPLEARLVAVADVLDALVAERPYKDAWSWDEAMAHLRAEAGRGLDPELVELAGRLAADGALEAVWQAAAQAVADGRRSA